MREDETFPTASTIKLSILYELFKQVDAGKVKVDVPEALPAAARAGGSGLVGELTALAAERLPSHQRPRHIAVVDALPRTATGKLQRFVLKARVESR